jgi:acyl-CoA synthetase (AMP-forming)/AMP-acid ligase II
MSGYRVTDWFEYTAKARPNLPFLIMGERTLSYADADAWANRWAQALVAKGLKVGDRIAYLSENALETGVMLMAAAKVGVAPFMLNYRLAPREWLGILRDAEPGMVLAAGAGYVRGLADLQLEKELPGVLQVALGEGSSDVPHGWLRLDDLLRVQPATRPEVAVDADDMLYLIYTSGTTGMPKGVMISHANALAHIEQAMSASPASKAPGERALVTTPLYHAAGVNRIINAAVKGGTVVLMAHFDAGEFVDTLERERINSCNMVPAIMQSLVDMPGIEKRHFEALRVIYYGAAPIGVPLLRRALEVFRCHLVQGYGLTEATGGFVYLNEVDHARALAGEDHLLRSTGRPVLADVRIVDEEGRDCGIDQPGELLVRGPNVMKGYWRNPEATVETVRDGWLHSGDVARIDAEGYVYLCDRLKDMVVSGGTNIYPREVEAVLQEHPAIVDVAVIGVPDIKWGEALMAVCVCRGTPPSVDELVEFCRTRLGGYKIPRRYEFVDELPRNPSGKVLKRVLREPHWKSEGRGIA